jgi:hypothetical protein
MAIKDDAGLDEEISTEISPGEKPSASLDAFDEQLKHTRREGAKSHRQTCKICFTARETLSEPDFKELADRHGWTAQEISGFAKTGEYLATLPDDKIACLPIAASTLYALARASDQVRDQAFAGGIVTTGLKRADLLNWLKAEKEKALLRNLVAKHGNIKLEDVIKKMDKAA